MNSDQEPKGPQDGLGSDHQGSGSARFTVARGGASMSQIPSTALAYSPIFQMRTWAWRGLAKGYQPERKWRGPEARGTFVCISLPPGVASGGTRMSCPPSSGAAPGDCWEEGFTVAPMVPVPALHPGQHFTLDKAAPVGPHAPQENPWCPNRLPGVS